jgi:hypothetical protein
VKIHIRAIELAQILGQPCEFQVAGGGAGKPPRRSAGAARGQLAAALELQGAGYEAEAATGHMEGKEEADAMRSRQGKEDAATGRLERKPAERRAKAEGGGVAAEVETLLREHNPAKLSSLPALLRKYEGREERLLTSIREKYSGGTVRPSSALASPPVEGPSVVARSPLHSRLSRPDSHGGSGGGGGDIEELAAGRPSSRGLQTPQEKTERRARKLAGRQAQVREAPRKRPLPVAILRALCQPALPLSLSPSARHRRKWRQRWRPSASATRRRQRVRRRRASSCG